MSADKKTEQKARGFSDIPIDVVENIVGNLGLVDKLSTRKVCRKLRTIIDKQKSKFDEVSLKITENSAEIEFEQHKKLEYSTYPMTALKEFSSVIANPKWSFKNLKFDFSWEENEDQDHPKPFLHLNSLLSNHKIHVEHLQIKGFTLLPAATLLPRFQPKILESLYLDFVNFDENLIEVIMVMDQWKSVKKLKMAFIPNWFSIENLFFAGEFQVLSSGITEARIEKIRDILFKSPTFEWCSLGFCAWYSDMGQDEILSVVDRIMGAHTAYNARNRRYQIDGSQDYFEISLEKDEEDNWWFLEFKRKTLE